MKHKQYQDRLRKAREIKTPAWFWAAHPDAIVSQHESEATKPKPQPEQPPAPQQEREVPAQSEAEKKALATLKAQDDYMRSCCMTTEDYDL